MDHVHVDRRGIALRSSRVPQSLQHVILASNRGNDVHVPPPQSVGNKVFYRGLLGRTFSSDPPHGPLREKVSKQASFALRFIAPRRKGSKRDASLVIPVDIDVVLKDDDSKSFKSIKSKYLDSMIGNRGYSVTSYAALETAYYRKPTALQLASYGTYVIHLVKTGNTKDLRNALVSGISSNACNAYNESLLHSICRRGETELLKVMIEAGCDLQVVDDKGRSLLHDACWAAEPAFGVVQILMEHDKHLFYIADSRGALPLSYTRKEHWSEWLQFLVSQKDTIWPRLTKAPTTPPLTAELPNTKPVAPPGNALTLELARMVADGKMIPEEARYMMVATDHTDVEDDESSSSSASDSTNFDDVSTDSETIQLSSQEDSWNEIQMKEILESFSSRRPMPLAW